MQLVKSLFTTALFVAALAEAKVSFTATPSSAQVGKQADIGWTGTSDPVTINLKKGDPKDLKTITTLTKDASGNSYQWTPSKDLASGKDYALEIKSGDDTNYSGQFEISGGKGPSKMAQEEKAVSSSAAVSASTVTPSSAASTGASTAASASAPSGTAAATGAAKPSASASASASGSGAKSTGNSPPMSNGSLRNIASPLALVAGVAAAMYLQ